MTTLILQLLKPQSDAITQANQQLCKTDAKRPKAKLLSANGLN